MVDVYASITRILLCRSTHRNGSDIQTASLKHNTSDSSYNEHQLDIGDIKLLILLLYIIYYLILYLLRKLKKFRKIQISLKKIHTDQPGNEISM